MLYRLAVLDCDKSTKYLEGIEKHAMLLRSAGGCCIATCSTCLGRMQDYNNVHQSEPEEEASIFLGFRVRTTLGPPPPPRPPISSGFGLGRPFRSPGVSPNQIRSRRVAGFPKALNPPKP